MSQNKPHTPCTAQIVSKAIFLEHTDGQRKKVKDDSFELQMHQQGNPTYQTGFSLWAIIAYHKFI